MTLICYSSTKQANKELNQSNSAAHEAECDCQLCPALALEWTCQPARSDSWYCCVWGRGLGTVLETRCDPVQSALGGPASAGGLDCTISRGPFQPQLFSASVWQMPERATVLPSTASHRAKNDSAKKTQHCINSSGVKAWGMQKSCAKYNKALPEDPREP